MTSTLITDGGTGVRGDRAHLTVDGALARVERQTDGRSALLFEHGTLRAKMYAPRGRDPQTPHAQDEVYVVARGRGTFFDGVERRPFGPGDLLFAAAGDPHRFEDFGDDLAVWVVFYGPDGGERPRA